jgi:uncharacterized protein (DUF1330 family)
VPAYLVYRARVRDMHAYREYMARTPGVIAAYGGRFLARDGAPAVIEGSDEGVRVILCEFPDRASALAFCASPEYAAIKPLRAHCAEVDMVVVEGLE